MNALQKRKRIAFYSHYVFSARPGKDFPIQGQWRVVLQTERPPREGRSKRWVALFLRARLAPESERGIAGQVVSGEFATLKTGPCGGGDHGGIVGGESQGRK